MSWPPINEGRKGYGLEPDGFYWRLGRWGPIWWVKKMFGVVR